MQDCKHGHFHPYPLYSFHSTLAVYFLQPDFFNDEFDRGKETHNPIEEDDHPLLLFYDLRTCEYNPSSPKQSASENR